MKRDPKFLRPGHGVERSRVKRRRRAFLIVSLVLFLVATAAVLVVFAYGVLTSPASFQVHEVVVSGTEFSDAGEIASTARGLISGNMLIADLQKVRAEVERHPWVRSARVLKVLPDTLRIEVTERLPNAFALIDGELFLTDDSGILIDRLRPEHPFTDLPVIRGLDGLESEDWGGRLTRAAGLLAELDDAHPSWRMRVSELVAGNPEKLLLRLNDLDCDLIVNESDFIGGLERYFSVEASIRKRYNEIDYIDLRFARRLVIKEMAE